jgi:hypothetical protein
VIHRHLDYPPGIPVQDLGPAALDDLLERGDLADWAPLAAAVRANPHGPLADTVLRLCAAHPMYGTSRLWSAWIASLRRARREAAPAAAGASLVELRRRRGLTQAAVGRRLGAAQSDVSKLERRGDLRLSTLRAYVEATGGRLDLFASYPDETVEIAPHRPGPEAGEPAT